MPFAVRRFSLLVLVLGEKEKSLDEALSRARAMLQKKSSAFRFAYALKKDGLSEKPREPVAFAEAEKTETKLLANFYCWRILAAMNGSGALCVVLSR